jgi:hypothetical protein
MELDYDKVLKEEEITITVGEFKYVVLPPTVGQLIDYDQTVEKLKDADGWENIANVYREAIRVVYSTVPVDVLSGLPVAGLKAMLADIQLLVTGGRKAVEEKADSKKK